MKKTNTRGILELTIILIVILCATLVLIPSNQVEEMLTNQTNNLNEDNFLNNGMNDNDQGLIQEPKEHTELFCENLCGNGFCDEHTLLDVDSACYETAQNCPIDC